MSTNDEAKTDPRLSLGSDSEPSEAEAAQDAAFVQRLQLLWPRPILSTAEAMQLEAELLRRTARRPVPRVVWAAAATATAAAAAAMVVGVVGPSAQRGRPQQWLRTLAEVQSQYLYGDPVAGEYGYQYEPFAGGSSDATGLATGRDTAARQAGNGVVEGGLSADLDTEAWIAGGQSDVAAETWLPSEYVALAQLAAPPEAPSDRETQEGYQSP